MKSIRHLIAAAALCVAGATPAFAAVNNGSFNDGLTGWQTIGDVSVQGAAKRAVLTTAYLDGDANGDEFFNHSGVSAVDVNDLAGFAGVNVGDLDVNGVAYEGSGIRQVLNVAAGDSLSLDFWFGLTSQSGDVTGFQDLAFVAINGLVVQTFSLGVVPSVGQFSYQFLTGGPVTLAFGIVDINDYAGVSEFRLDNISVTAVPEPETIAMLLAGLGVIGATVRRRRATNASA
jgi:hypothetical protein